MNKRTLTIGFGAALVALAALIFFSVPRSGSKLPGLAVTPTPSSASQTYEGTLTCLPHHGDGPFTAECAIGLKSSAGTYYAIKATGAPALQQSVGTPLKITGKLGDDAKLSATYDIAGVIEPTEPITAD